MHQPTERAVIVTGGAGGLGAGIAERLAADGYHAAVTDIDGDGAERLAASLRDRGFSASGYALDVSDADSVAAVVREIVRTAPPLYGLVNNAGIGRATPFLEIEPDAWDRVFAVNARGPYLMSRAALPAMIENGSGGIVNISSIAGKEGFPLWTSYGATKHAIIGLTRGLAKEFGRSGIRVNAVCPGAVKTGIWAPEFQGTEDPDSVFDAQISQTALGVAQTVEDIAAAVAFLLSDQSAKITGVALSVDSGLVLS